MAVDEVTSDVLALQQRMCGRKHDHPLDIQNSMRLNHRSAIDHDLLQANDSTFYVHISILLVICRL